MNEMNEHQVPNLADMDEQEAARFLIEGMSRMSPEWEYQTRHEDYIMEMPQSGERIRGRKKMREFQEAYADNSTPPSITLRRIIVRENLWVGDSVADYGGHVFHGAAILELKDGKIWRDTRYYAEPFEAPEWRAQWVEKMESGETDATHAPDEWRDAMDQDEERPGPNLEAMDEREAARLLTELATNLSPEGEYRIRHPEDYVMEMPQSGEIFRGRENMRAFQEGYLDHSAPPSIRIRRVIVREGAWVVEPVVDYGGQIVYGVAILELRDGKIWRDTRYFAELFEAPAWRAQWVERMETGA